MTSVISLEIRSFFSSLPEIRRCWGEEEPTNFFVQTLVLPGWLGIEPFYDPFRHRLRDLGHRTSFLSRGYSWSQVTRPFDEFEKAVEALVKTTGPIDYVIGHSTGAVEALALFEKIPGLKKVIAIKPALELGISEAKMDWYRWMGVVPEPVEGPCQEALIEKAMPHQDRLVTIGLESDWLCLSGAAKEVFPEATHHVIREEPGTITPHGSLWEIPEIFEIIEQETAH